MDSLKQHTRYIVRGLFCDAVYAALGITTSFQMRPGTVDIVRQIMQKTVNTRMDTVGSALPVAWCK